MFRLVPSYSVTNMTIVACNNASENFAIFHTDEETFVKGVRILS